MKYKVTLLLAAFALVFTPSALAVNGDGGGGSGPLTRGQCQWYNVGATLDSGPGWRYTCGSDGWVYYNGSWTGWD